VTVQYRGKLLDGSEVRQLVRARYAASFTVNGVIPGLAEALGADEARRQVAAVRGRRTRLRRDPKPDSGGSLLIFDVELVSVKSSARRRRRPSTRSQAQSK